MKYTTDDEIDYLKGLGYWTEETMDLTPASPEVRDRRLKLLYSYRERMYQREWGKLDQNKIFQAVEQMIAELESPVIALPQEVPVPKQEAWKCYACMHVGKAEEFGSQGDHLCPKCKSEDVFPERRYRCTACGAVGSQEFWFGPDAELDVDPIVEGFEANPCKNCVDKFEQGEIGKTPDNDEDIAEYYAKVKRLQQTPAKVEEVPVELPLLLPKD